MVKTIRQSMKTAIDAVSWMDDTTKASGQKKLANMIQNIAFPSPDLYNETYVLRDFKKVMTLSIKNQVSNTLNFLNLLPLLLHLSKILIHNNFDRLTYQKTHLWQIDFLCLSRLRTGIWKNSVIPWIVRNGEEQSLLWMLGILRNWILWVRPICYLYMLAAEYLHIPSNDARPN